MVYFVEPLELDLDFAGLDCSVFGQGQDTYVSFGFQTSAFHVGLALIEKYYGIVCFVGRVVGDSPLRVEYHTPGRLWYLVPGIGA
jgi:hypothetical protein